jgi:hypothetical protein
MDHFFHINVFDSRGLPFYIFNTIKIEWNISSNTCGPLDELSSEEIS